MSGGFNQLRANAWLSRHGQMILQGRRGHRREPEGIRRPLVCGGVVQLVRTPACHAGGRGFESPSLPPLELSRIYSIPINVVFTFFASLVPAQETSTCEPLCCILGYPKLSEEPSATTWELRMLPPVSTRDKTI